MVGGSIRGSRALGPAEEVAVPIKREISQGVDLNRLAQAAAIELKAQADAFRDSPVHRQDEADTFYVLETVVNAEPTYRWDVISGCPYGIQPFGVTASFSEATRNKESLRSLLERRMRRGFRDRLLALKVMPETEALARVLRLQVAVS